MDTMYLGFAPPSFPQFCRMFLTKYLRLNACMCIQHNIDHPVPPSEYLNILKLRVLPAYSAKPIFHLHCATLGLQSVCCVSYLKTMLKTAALQCPKKSCAYDETAKMSASSASDEGFSCTILDLTWKSGILFCS